MPYEHQCAKEMTYKTSSKTVNSHLQGLTAVK